MRLNNSPSVDAILLERGRKANMTLAVASSIDYLSELISVEKDVDGEHPITHSGDCFHSLLPESSVLPLPGSEGVQPCTVAGVLELIDHYQYSNSIQGANVVVVGRSRKLGDY
jgi:5,10-methylene-tetrahydrofolate dehydrogenase/methenyl tetrahydrofolate cyclohydrolase